MMSLRPGSTPTIRYSLRRVKNCPVCYLVNFRNHVMLNFYRRLYGVIFRHLDGLGRDFASVTKSRRREAAKVVTKFIVNFSSGDNLENLGESIRRQLNGRGEGGVAPSWLSAALQRQHQKHKSLTFFFAASTRRLSFSLRILGVRSPGVPKEASALGVLSCMSSLVVEDAPTLALTPGVA